MGTRGYKVYRHKKRFFVYYNHMDSYPDGLGLDLWASVPHGNPAAFDEWLKARRAECDKLLSENDDDEEDDFDLSIRTEAPIRDMMIEWVYELDLDTLVFWVQSKPVFCLSNLPPTGNGFLSGIGQTSYGQLSHSSGTPVEHRFSATWNVKAPEVDQAVLDAYLALEAVESQEMLCLPSSSVTPIRRRFLEVSIGNRMHHGWIYMPTLEALQAKGRGGLSDRSVCASRILLALALCTPMLCGDSVEDLEESDMLPPSIDFAELSWWPRDYLCVYLSTHLEDLANFQAALVGIVAAMKEGAEVGPDRPVFGVLFSLAKCAVVRIDLESDGAEKITHSPVVDFLPSWHATSPDTPGIALLASLSEYFDALADGNAKIQPPSDSQSDTLKFPVELVDQIISAVDDGESLLNIARASLALKRVMAPTLIHPYFAGHFILEMRDVKDGAGSYRGRTARDPCGLFTAQFLCEDRLRDYPWKLVSS